MARLAPALYRSAAMPTVFFHLHNDVNTPDLTGTEFASLDEARDYALAMVRFEIAETVKKTGRVVLSHRMDLEDETGRVLDTVHFRDALRIEP
jgi:hypothetical protein